MSVCKNYISLHKYRDMSRTIDMDADNQQSERVFSECSETSRLRPSEVRPVPENIDCVFHAIVYDARFSPGH